MPYRETNPTATPALINDAPRAHEDDSFGQRGVCPRLPVKVRSGFPLSARPLTIALTGQGLDAVRAGIYRRALPLATRNLVIGHPALGEWSGTSGGLVLGIEHALTPDALTAALPPGRHQRRPPVTSRAHAGRRPGQQPRLTAPAQGIVRGTGSPAVTTLVRDPGSGTDA